MVEALKFIQDRVVLTHILNMQPFSSHGGNGVKLQCISRYQGAINLEHSQLLADLIFCPSVELK